MINTAPLAPRQPTTLSEQMDRLAILVDQAGRNGQRAYGVASTLNGHFPMPGVPVSDEREELSGQLAALRSMLDDLESRLGSTGFVLSELENALSPQVKSASGSVGPDQKVAW